MEKPEEDVKKTVKKTVGGFQTDAGGLALALNDVKLMTTETASSWNTRLSQIARMKGKVIICTYSLPNLKYMEKIFDKRSWDVVLIANDKPKDNEWKVQELQERYPDMEIYLKPDIHAKIILIEPKTVWLSSANFGRSGWFENTIGIHDKEAYDFYYKQISKYMGFEV